MGGLLRLDPGVLDRVRIPILLTLVFTGCFQGPTGRDGAPGRSCSVEQLDEGLRVVCDDGTTAWVPNGEPGAPGQDGVDGQDGEDGYLTRITESFICVGRLEGTSVDYFVEGALFNSSDLFLSATVRDPSNSSSYTTFFPSNDQTIVTAYVSFDTDGVPDGGFYRIEMEFYESSVRVYGDRSRTGLGVSSLQSQLLPLVGQRQTVGSKDFLYS